MNSRKKVTAEPILHGYHEIDDAIREWGGLDVQVDAIANAQQKAIDAIKGKFEEKAEPLIARKVRLEKDLKEFAEYHKIDFEKERSRKLTFGKIGFRASSELKYLKGWNAKKVLQKLKELGRVEFIKKTESIKRADIKKSDLDAASLKMFGCCIADKDEFYFEPDNIAISNAKSKLELVKKAS